MILATVSGVMGGNTLPTPTTEVYRFYSNLDTPPVEPSIKYGVEMGLVCVTRVSFNTRVGEGGCTPRQGCLHQNRTPSSEKPR